MATLSNLNVSLGLGSANFASGLNDATKRVKQFQSATNASSASIASQFNEAVPAVGNLTSKFAALGPVGLAVAASLGAVTAGFAALKFGAETVISATLSAIERVGETVDVAERVGISVAALETLRLAASETGLSASELDSDIERMVKNLGKAAVEGGASAEAFERLGLDVQHLQKIGAEAAFNEIADKIAAIEDPAERAAAATDIFGKSGMALINVLSQGSQGLEEARNRAELFGLAISEMEAAKLDEAGDALGRIGKIFEGLATQIALEFADEITAVANAFERLVKILGGVPQFTADYFRFLKQELSFILDVLQKMNPILGRAIALLAAIGMDQIQQMEDAVKKAEELDRKIADMNKKLGADKYKDAQPLPGEETPEAEGPKTEVDMIASEAKRIEDMLARLEKEAAQFGMETWEKQLADLEEAGATQEQLLQAAEALLDIENKRTAALAEQKAIREAELAATEAAREAAAKDADLNRRADRARDAIETPLQKFQEEITNLQELVDARKLTSEEAFMAGEKARDALARQFDKDAGITTGGQAQNPALQAAERGSAEAFSAINRARFGKDPQQQVAQNTKQGVDELKKANSLLEDLKNRQPQPVQPAIF